MLAPLHFSQLKHIAKSPQHFRHELDNARQDKRHFRLGRALDCLITGRSGGIVVYDGERRGKKWAEFSAAQSQDAEIITAAELPSVEGMANAIRGHQDALMLLVGERQHTFQWDIAGRRCEGTPDCFTPRRVVDLKSTRCADPKRFKWDARKLGYHAQLSWYGNGLAAAGLSKPTEHFIVAVESEAPFPVVVFELTATDMELGTRCWRAWFETLRVCEESGDWPGYSVGRVPLDLPEFLEEE